MRYQQAFAYTRPAPKPDPAHDARVARLRATSSLCVETEALWHLRHAWLPHGVCKRCGVKLTRAEQEAVFESAPVPPFGNVALCPERKL